MCTSSHNFQYRQMSSEAKWRYAAHNKQIICQELDYCPRLKPQKAQNQLKTKSLLPCCSPDIDEKQRKYISGQFCQKRSAYSDWMNYFHASCIPLQALPCTPLCQKFHNNFRKARSSQPFQVDIASFLKFSLETLDNTIAERRYI